MPRRDAGAGNDAIAIIRGNGVTDDTEALRAYFAGADVLDAQSGRRLNLFAGDEIPRGTYRIVVRMPEGAE